MADYCHDWEPGGLGCNGVGEGNCPPDCFGDFTSIIKKYSGEIEVGEEIMVGICEGHGAYVILFRDEEGLGVTHLGAQDGKIMKELTRKLKNE